MNVSSWKKRKFRRTLLSWYKRNGRHFSWRHPKRNSYEILIAEIMLRKTDTSKVVHIYDAFINKHPSPKSLALSREDSLRREIRILGIADRARLLGLLGHKIVEEYEGRVPRDFEALIALPGVGTYTANAVLCFAFRKDVPLLDTNIIRVFDRAFSVRSNRPRARDDPALWNFAATLVPKNRAITYNRALLDFAAVICTARNPKCLACPLKNICSYFMAYQSSTASR